MTFPRSFCLLQHTISGQPIAERRSAEPESTILREKEKHLERLMKEKELDKEEMVKLEQKNKEVLFRLLLDHFTLLNILSFPRAWQPSARRAVINRLSCSDRCRCSWQRCGRSAIHYAHSLTRRNSERIELLCVSLKVRTLDERTIYHFVRRRVASSSRILRARRRRPEKMA